MLGEQTGKWLFSRRIELKSNAVKRFFLLIDILMQLPRLDNQGFFLPDSYQPGIDHTSIAAAGGDDKFKIRSGRMKRSCAKPSREPMHIWQGKIRNTPRPWKSASSRLRMPHGLCFGPSMIMTTWTEKPTPGGNVSPKAVLNLARLLPGGKEENSTRSRRSSGLFRKPIGKQWRTSRLRTPSMPGQFRKTNCRSNSEESRRTKLFSIIFRSLFQARGSQSHGLFSCTAGRNRPGKSRRRRYLPAGRCKTHPPKTNSWKGESGMETDKFVQNKVTQMPIL